MMSSDQPSSLHLTEVDSAADQNPSVSSPPSHVAHHSESRLVHSRRREMDEHERDGLEQGPPNDAVGQFSFAPTTRTTVVTTTTTTTTSFPPLIFRPPRAIQDLDARQYPLAASPTPASLRNLKFKVGDKSIVFNEPEDTVLAANEVRLLYVLRSVNAYVVVVEGKERCSQVF